MASQHHHLKQETVSCRECEVFILHVTTFYTELNSTALLTCTYSIGTDEVTSHIVSDD